jgi:hypothetical protein
MMRPERRDSEWRPPGGVPGAPPIQKISLRRLACCVPLAAIWACAPAKPSLPTGAGTPLAGFEAVYDEAVRDCRSARSVVADLGLSGRAGDTRLRGRISAGLLAPSGIRLEGVAFARPIFILAGRDGQATLLLTRENRIVRNAPPAAIVEALTGVALGPSALIAAIAGCGLGAASPSNGRSFGSDSAAVDVADDKGTTFLRRIDNRWRVVGVVRGDLTMLYADFAGGLPATVHIRTGTVADITLRVSQLEINTEIDAKAFEVNVPPDAAALTVEELRRAGPLGEKSGG